MEITVPENMTIAATGNLKSPESEIARLESISKVADKLDSFRENKERKKIKKILKPIKEAILSSAQKTLHFHAEKVDDFAWVANSRFILKQGSYRNVTITVSVLSNHEHQGRKAVEYTFDTLENYGKYYGPYLYDQVSIANGGIYSGGGRNILI